MNRFWNCSFSLLQVAACAILLAAGGLAATRVFAQDTDDGFHPYHYEPYHFESSQPQPYHYEPYHFGTYDSGSHGDDNSPGSGSHDDRDSHGSGSHDEPYQYEPFHSTFDQGNDNHSTYNHYDWSNHSSHTDEGPADTYHSFTMDPPYAPSDTPRYKYESGADGDGTIEGPNGPVWHDNLGHVDVNAEQKRGADVTFHDPFLTPKMGGSLFPGAPSHDEDQKNPGGGWALPYHLRPENAEKTHEEHNDAPPGPYGSVAPIVNPVAPSGN